MSFFSPNILLGSFARNLSSVYVDNVSFELSERRIRLVQESLLLPPSQNSFRTQNENLKIMQFFQGNLNIFRQFT